ncbi:MAG: hypothetical protein DMG30_18390 [Acidobacteria bacterium]|nr:MAG: hypothetical protein DMG30_18390 [Acidobacteriota bacterium]
MLHQIVRSVVALLLLHVVPAVALDNDEVVRKLAAHANSAYQGTITRSELEDSARTLAAYRQSEAGARALKQIDTILLLNPERFQRALTGREINRLFTRLQTAGYVGDLSSFTRAMGEVNKDRFKIYRYITEHGVQHVLWQVEHQYHLTPVPTSYIPGLLPLATIQAPVLGFFNFWSCGTLEFGSKAVLFLAAAAAVTGNEEIALALGFTGAMGELIYLVYC